MVSGLILAVIKADVNYFRHQRFVSSDEYERVLWWLQVCPDHEIQEKVAGWLESDAQYFRDLGPPLYRHHWYIFPIVWLAVTAMSHALSKYSRKLREYRGLTPAFSRARKNSPDYSPESKNQVDSSTIPESRRGK